MNIRLKWFLLFSVIIATLLACSKKEETPPPASVEKARQAMKEAHEGMKQVHEGMVAGMGLGKAVYEKTCAACHATGVAGAPKVGDKEAWAGHIAEGLEHLVQVAMKGEGAMPPKGGNPDLSEEEIRAAVTYMLDQSR